VHIEGASVMGIVINACRYAWVLNCQVNNTLRDGIHFVHSQDFYCMGNHVSNTGDDAICAHWYGSLSAPRMERGIISGNSIYNCVQGISLTNAADITVVNNRVEKTILSGCQITTQDAFDNGDPFRDGEIKRIKLIGNTFIESGTTITLRGKETPNMGQCSTGRAAIVVCYLDQKDRWSKPGEDFFSTQEYPCSAFSENSFVTKGDVRERFIVGRRIRLAKNKDEFFMGKVSKTALRCGDTEFWLQMEKGEKLSVGDFKLSFSRILTDIDIINNEIYNSAVNGIHASTVYRLRVCGNRMFNCNQSNTQWTGSIVEILTGKMVEFTNNWIVEEGINKFHKTPFTITAQDVVSKDNFVR
jgi:parallel beta-helix repeat protein